MVEKTDYNILNPEGGNEVEGKEPYLGEKAKQMLNRLRFSIGDALMTPKKRKAKEETRKIRDGLIAQKHMMIETYNKYPQETKDRIKQELKELYEKYETGQLMDFDVGDSNAPSFYRYIRPKEESSNKDYTDFFGVLFDGIDPQQSTYEEVKIKSSLINGVIKGIIGEEEMKRIEDKVRGPYKAK